MTGGEGKKMPASFKCESENLNVAHDIADGSGWGDDPKAAEDAAQRDSIDNAIAAARKKLDE